ncbi:enamine deaminase RidA [Humibacillus sp. DSM 29435]|uniref:RidA family protein n=1 Tax=Humibacillus sp. DSM 29435 TaxID=1869167 RepID=UPI0008725FE3|nr:RidA family protein [Humibacillus sp. DSM 29435]OFE14941.1 enamine deaminase RidA [Humibacillus sp. DSM 29435]
MTIELFNPPGIPTPEAYAQVSVATGARTVYVSGQVARNAEGQPVGAGDLAAQVEQAYRNVHAALRGVGAGFQHVAKLTVYVVDWHPDKMPELLTGAIRAAEDLGLDIVRPITLIGVAALGEADMLVEVEAVAVID